MNYFSFQQGKLETVNHGNVGQPYLRIEGNQQWEREVEVDSMYSRPRMQEITSYTVMIIEINIHGREIMLADLGKFNVPSSELLPAITERIISLHEQTAFMMSVESKIPKIPEVLRTLELNLEVIDG